MSVLENSYKERSNEEDDTRTDIAYGRAPEREYGGGHWDFRFCGFGYFLDRFFGFCAKRLWFFGFGVRCGLRIFRFLASGFRFS